VKKIFLTLDVKAEKELGKGREQEQTSGTRNSD